MKRNGLHRALGTLALCMVGVAAQAQSGYSLTLIGEAIPNDPISPTIVSDISDRGDVTGARVQSNGQSVAFIWRNGVFRNLNAKLSTHDAITLAINDSLDVVGTRRDAQDLAHPFLLRGTGQVIAITAPAGQDLGRASDVNNRRQVLVAINNPGSENQFALWQAGQLSELERLPGSQSTVANRLNDVGVVVGTASFAAGSNAVLWQSDTIMQLPRPNGSTFVDGIDISNDGTVMMSAIFPTAPAHSSVVLWKEGQLTVLRSLSGLPWADAGDISNRNVIVGRSFKDSAASSMTATIWRNGRPSDLNARVLSADPLKPFVHLQWGLLVSDWGYIVARGVDSRSTDDRYGFYLLTPH